MRDSYLLYKDKLKGEYKEAFDKVELYMDSGNYDDFSIEDRLSTFLDMLLSAQEKNKPVEKIVGKDIQKFCKMFCSDMGAKSRVLKIMDIIKRIAIIELIFAVLELFLVDLPTNESFMDAMTMGMASGYLVCVGVYVIFGLFMDVLIRSLLFKYKVGIRKIKAVRVALLIAMFGSAFLVFDYMPLVACPIWIVLAVCSAYLVFYYIYNQKRLAENKPRKITFADMVKTQSALDADKMQEQRYKILNKRNIKKGKGILSMEEFLDMEEKDCAKNEKMKPLYYIIPLVMTILNVLTTDFEDLFSAIFYISMHLVIYFAAMRFAWKIAKGTFDVKREWIANKRAELAGEIIPEDDEFSEEEE